MKKAYTLIEILIIVIIIALMIGVFGFFMPNRENEKIKFGNDSTSIIYAGIINEYNKLNRGYIENFSGKNQQISSLTINFGKNPLLDLIVTENYDLGEHLKKTLQQTNDKYIIQAGIANQFISIKKEHFRESEFEIKVCDFIDNDFPHPENCILISKIIFNQASQKIEQKFCLDFSGSVCNEWEQ